MALNANENRLPEVREDLLMKIEKTETKDDFTLLLVEYPELFALVRHGINAISVTGVKVDLSHYLIYGEESGDKWLNVEQEAIKTLGDKLKNKMIDAGYYDIIADQYELDPNINEEAFCDKISLEMAYFFYSNVALAK